MGEVYIKDYGRFKIQGDKITKEELSEIKNYVASDEYKNTQAEKNTDEHLNGTSWGRLAAEVGLSLAGVGLSGGFALPLVAARMGMLSRPFLLQLAKSSAGSGIGSGTGAAISETFDPTSDPYQTIVSAVKEGIVAEGVGAPLGIGAFNRIARIVRPSLQAHQVAKSGEEAINATKKRILDNPEQFPVEVVAAAQKALVTPGIKYNNDLVNIMESIGKASFLGKGLRQVGEANVTIAEQNVKNLLGDYNNQLINGMKNNQVDRNGVGFGQLLLNTVGKRKGIWEENEQLLYNNVDDLYDDFIKGLAQKDAVTIGGRTVPGSMAKYSIDATPLTNAINEFVDELGPSRFLSEDAMGIVKKLRLFINDVNSGSNRIQGKITFKEAQQLKKDLNALYRSAIPKQNKEAYGNIINSLSRATQNMLNDKSVPEVLKGALQEADLYTKTGKEFWEKDLIGKLLKEYDSSNLGDAAYRQVVKFDSPQLISQMKESLKEGVEKGLFTKTNEDSINRGFKAQLLKDVIVRSEKAGNVFGVSAINATKFDNLVRPDGKAYQALKEVFSDAEMKNIQKAANALKTASGELSKEGGLPGKMFVQLGQAGAFYDLLSRGFTKGVFTFLAVPGGISKLFTSPRYNKLLEKGYKNFTDEITEIYSKTKNVDDINISNLRKSATSFRVIVERMAAENMITEDDKVKFNSNIEERLVQDAKTFYMQNEVKTDDQNLENQIKNEVETPKRRPDPLDEALDSLGPMSSAPAPTPQPQGQAPQAQGSGIASLGNQTDQLARMEQVGLPLFRG